MVNNDNVIGMGKNIDFVQNLGLDSIIFIDEGVGSSSTDHTVYDPQGNALGHYDTNLVMDRNNDGSLVEEMADIDQAIIQTGATTVLNTLSAEWVDAGSVEGTLGVGLDNLNAENKLTMTTQHIDATKSAQSTAKRSIQIA